MKFKRSQLNFFVYHKVFFPFDIDSKQGKNSIDLNFLKRLVIFF